MQVARDGEDYAACMLGLYAEPPFRGYIDCAGTLAAACSGRWGKAATTGDRAHLWTRFHAAFAGEDVAFSKVKAHCSAQDVRDGRTTAWLKGGNDAALVWLLDW